MTPEQIYEAQQEQTSGCKSCHWYGGDNTGGGRQSRRVCDASQPAFPDGGKDICGTWYKPRTAKKRFRGR